MYNATQLRHLARECFIGLARRKISGAVAVVIMGSALLMLALFSLITINLDGLLQNVRREVDMTVYLEPNIHSDDRERLRKDLQSTQGVLAVSFLSADDALKVFREELGPRDADLLAALDSNPLSASLELRLDTSTQDAARIADLVHTVSQYPGVEEVVTAVERISRLDQATRIFVIVDVIVGILVLLSALFVISNTVRLTIEECALQVEIMKLVGATNWFIQAPFVMAGAIQGAAAGALAMGVLLFSVRLVRAEVGGIAFFANEQMAGFVLLSTLLGAGGSLLALRRHLTL